MYIKSLKDVIPFGKYKGLTVEETLYTNHNYIHWLIKNNVVTFEPKVLEWLKQEISDLHLQNYNSPSEDDGYGISDDDPFYGWRPH